jgi:hypothetical protein
MTRTRITRRTFVVGSTGVATGAFITSRLSSAQTPEASPAASPAALPEGPLGTAIAWLEVALNAPGGPGEDAVMAAFSPIYLQAMPPADIIAVITSLSGIGGPWSVDTSSMIMTMDYPPSNASFFIDEPGGQRLHAGISIDGESGLIGALTLEPAGAEASPEASPLA